MCVCAVDIPDIYSRRRYTPGKRVIKTDAFVWMCGLHTEKEGDRDRYTAISAFTSAAIAIERERGRKGEKGGKVFKIAGRPSNMGCMKNREIIGRHVTRIKFHGHRLGSVSRQIFI